VPRQHASLTEAIFHRIRSEILAGELRPGSRLRFAEMCERYGTSVGVVREALSRLAEQGLVRSEPQLGFSVAPVSLEGLIELTESRCEIEGLVFRRAVREGSLEWESAIVAAHHTLHRTPTRIDGHFNEAWATAHKAFHLALLTGCSNSRLLNIALSLRDAAEFYRRAVERPAGHSAQRDVTLEHQELLDAALARDEERAAAAIAHHIQATADYLIENGAGQFAAEAAETAR
jgi:DNA-binding GntR family transcriptional regulator